jgi:tRNA pseudouridine55 synthase
MPLIQDTFSAKPPSGIALIDKPSGISSHRVVNSLRSRYRVKTIGHAGTLDPLASGLLICLVGREFTKQQDRFLKQPKSYDCVFSLGFTTDTYDRTGDITSKSDWAEVQKITQAQFLKVLSTFVGQQTQTVPAFSAVKVQGKKLYERVLHQPDFDLATLPSKSVTITRLELLSWQLDTQKQTISGSLSLDCSSGTYVRSLIHDLGQKLGVGACVMELRRTSIGTISITQAHQLDAPDIPLLQKVTI